MATYPIIPLVSLLIAKQQPGEEILALNAWAMDEHIPPEEMSMKVVAHLFVTDEAAAAEEDQQTYQITALRWGWIEKPKAEKLDVCIGASPLGRLWVVYTKKPVKFYRTLEEIRADTATLSMVFAALRHKVEIPDEARPHQLLWDGLLVCNFVDHQRLPIADPADTRPLLLNRHSNILIPLYLRFEQKQNEQGTRLLKQLYEQLPAVKQTIISLLHLKTVTEQDLKQAHDFFHTLYWLF